MLLGHWLEMRAVSGARGAGVGTFKTFAGYGGGHAGKTNIRRTALGIEKG